MAVRVRSQIIVVASLDTEELQIQFKRETKNLTSQIDSFEAENSGAIVLGASEVNYSLPMGKVVGGRLLYIETDKPIRVRLDNEVTGHVVAPFGAGTKGKLFLMGQFTSPPIITNLDPLVANVAFFIGGQLA